MAKKTLHKSLSIIIPNYNGEKLIPVFFPSVLKAVKNYKGRSEILFVDDCSQDRSIEFIKEYTKKNRNLKIFQAHNNGGFSRTCNLGIQNAKNEILFFLNTDVELKEDFFQYFSRHFDDNDVFAVTICGYQYQTDRQIDGIKLGYWSKGNLRVTKNIMNDIIFERRLSEPFLSFTVQGSYFFAQHEKVKELSGFDELYSPYIFEETDMAYRALKKGWKIIYEPRSIAYHQLSSSIKSVANKIKIKTISTRNRMIFTWKNIHSKSYLFSSLLVILLKLMVLNIVQWKATIQALKSFKEIMKKRRKEKMESVICDRDLMKFYKNYFSSK